MVSPCMSYAMKPLTALPSVGRRQFLFFLTATTAFTVREATSVAQDIPLFGIRKSLKKAEEEVEEIVKEGFEAADKGLVATEKGLSLILLLLLIFASLLDSLFHPNTPFFHSHSSHSESDHTTAKP